MPVVEDILWKNPGNPGMIVVTAHASIDEEGKLFMGYGVTGEAVRRIPDIERECAEVIRTAAVDGVYGFLPVRPARPEMRVVGFGLFQTRKDWEDLPDLNLIQYSMNRLRQYTETNTNVRIRMNFPGVGEGGLPAEKISPVLIPLPPTVTVCHQGEIQTSFPADFTGFKALYVQVETMLLEGKYDQAVEHLLMNGFDIQSAYNQVNAVQRLLHERHETETRQIERWRARQPKLF